MGDRKPRRRLGRPPIDEVPEGERRAHILRAADHLFGRRGYAAVSIGDIAAEVGVSKAAIYHHFPSKDTLFAAVMCETLGMIGGAIQLVMDGPGTVREKIRQLIEIAVLRVPLDADMDSMMRDAHEHLPPARQQEIEEANAAMRGLMVELMRQGIEWGELKPADPRLLGHAFWALLGGFVGREAAEAGFAGRPEAAMAVADLFLEGIQATADAA